MRRPSAHPTIRLTYSYFLLIRPTKSHGGGLRRGARTRQPRAGKTAKSVRFLIGFHRPRAKDGHHLSTNPSTPCWRFGAALFRRRSSRGFPVGSADVVDPRSRHRRRKAPLADARVMPNVISGNTTRRAS